MDRIKPSSQPFDESLEVNDSEEIHTPTPQAAAKTELKAKGRKVRSLTGANSSSDEYDEEDTPQKTNKPITWQAQLSPNEEDEEEDSDEDDSDDDDDDDDDEPGPEGAYDPADYENLLVSTEIKELFQYITRYTSSSIELEHKLKPFIPDFIPAVGDIDAFLKVPRPDGKPDDLGLLVLDEPCVKQSDPTVLSLWLSEETKQHGVTELKKVTSVSSPQRNPKPVDSWIESITDLHRSKPPASVHYSRPMPDIDSLMQEWPQEFEELLARVDLPTAEVDCDLKQYVDIICGMLDIPIYKNRVQSLHVLFTLYLEFKNLQLFKHTA